MLFIKFIILLIIFAVATVVISILLLLFKLKRAVRTFLRRIHPVMVHLMALPVARIIMEMPPLMRKSTMNAIPKTHSVRLFLRTKASISTSRK